MKKSIKIFIIIVIIVIIALAILGIIYGIVNKQGVFIDDDIYHYTDDIYYYTPPEGSLKTCGVVVKAEKEAAYIMPIIEKPIILEPKEKDEDKEYYSTSYYNYDSNQFDLKRGQEVILTYHYEKDEKSRHKYDAIIDNAEIVNEESEIEIPRDIILEAYSSKDKVSIDLNEKEFNNQKVEFTVTDNNEYKYDYSKMRYIIDDHNLMNLPKISDIPNEKEFEIDENGKVSINIDWSEVYGKLEEGKYRLTLLTLNHPRRSIIDPNKMEYPNCGVIITIDFTIKSNGNVKVTYTHVG